MATFQLSPGVIVNEYDITTIVPSVGTTEGAYAGDFNWGPLDQIVTVADEVQLVNYFGKPDANNFRSFFTCANFLSYGNNLKVVRSANTAVAKNATADGTGLLIKNLAKYESSYLDGQGSVGSWAARFPSNLGNSLMVSICPSSAAFSANMTATATTVTGSNVVNFSANVITDSARPLSVGDQITVGSLGSVEVLAIGGSSSNVVTVNATMTGNLTANTVVAKWKWAGDFNFAPGTSAYAQQVNGSGDEMHIVVVDRLGQFTGSANTVLERYGFVSKASDASNDDGTTNYYRDVIKNRSAYVYWMDHLLAGTNWGSLASATTFTAVNKADYAPLSGGALGAPTDANRITSYGLFRNADDVDISLILTGEASATLQTYVIQNVAEYRKDCVAFVTPPFSAAVDNQGGEQASITAYRNTSLPSSSYAVIDSAWKYQIDKYNNVYRWVPLNGDIAGLCVKTDTERSAWESPAGFNRGQIKNVTKLSWNPSKTDRDELYKVGINPCVSFPAEGPILYGDKTLLNKPSAFDRINVRRLFIVLEKAIAKAARYSLFEINDQFTRAQFVNMVEPFLRSVKGRRGIYDYRVVCNEVNNTPQIIDSNQFVGDILIKPARSINFITLNFVAVGTGVSFDEIVGTY